MTVQREKVYVFISSTFNDMHAERDYLVKQVFPPSSSRPTGAPWPRRGRARDRRVWHPQQQVALCSSASAIRPIRVIRGSNPFNPFPESVDSRLPQG